MALSILNGLGPVRSRLLMDAVGSVEGIFTEKASSLEKIDGCSAYIIGGLDREKAIVRAQQELEFIEATNVQLHFYKSFFHFQKAYFYNLLLVHNKRIKSYPLLIYMQYSL